MSAIHFVRHERRPLISRHCACGEISFVMRPKQEIAWDKVRDNDFHAGVQVF